MMIQQSLNSYVCIIILFGLISTKLFILILDFLLKLAIHYFLCPRDRWSGGILFLSCLLFCPPLWNFYLANNFRTVSARALIFHMSIPCDKTFPWVPLLFYPVTLTLEFDSFFETQTLLIIFEQWVLELWYFIWIFHVIRPFSVCTIFDISYE